MRVVTAVALSSMFRSPTAATLPLTVSVVRSPAVLSLNWTSDPLSTFVSMHRRGGNTVVDQDIGCPRQVLVCERNGLASANLGDVSPVCFGRPTDLLDKFCTVQRGCVEYRVECAVAGVETPVFHTRHQRSDRGQRGTPTTFKLILSFPPPISFAESNWSGLSVAGAHPRQRCSHCRCRHRSSRTNVSVSGVKVNVVCCVAASPCSS